MRIECLCEILKFCIVAQATLLQAPAGAAVAQPAPLPAIPTLVAKTENKAPASLPAMPKAPAQERKHAKCISEDTEAEEKDAGAVAEEPLVDLTLVSQNPKVGFEV